MLSKRICEQCNEMMEIVDYELGWMVRCRGWMRFLTPVFYTAFPPSGCPFDLEHRVEMERENAEQENLSEVLEGKKTGLATDSGELARCGRLSVAGGSMGEVS